MTEHDLLASVIAAPGDDEPRLVYADWLQQRGDPRGELIAVQCRLAREDPDAPDPDLVARERELLDGEPFTAELEAIVPGTYELRRGFVEHVHTYERLDDERSTQLFAAAPLLRSAAVRWTLLDKEVPPAWARLSALTLHEGCYLTPDAVADLARSPSLGGLRRLHAIDAAFERESVATLFEMPQPFEHFGLTLVRGSPTGGGPTPRGLAARLAETRWPLRSLVLGGLDLDDLAPLAAFGGELAQLAIADCRNQDAAGLRAIAQLAPSLPRLTTLELDYDDEVPTHGLADVVEAVPSLRWLRVRGAGVTTHDVRKLVASPAAKQLRRLDLSRNAIDDDGVRMLLDELPELRWLDVTNRELRLDGSTQQLVAERNAAWPVVQRRYPRVPQTVVDELVQDRKIGAIKAYREATGAGLLEAKLAVERIGDERGTTIRRLPRTSWIGAWSFALLIAAVAIAGCGGAPRSLPPAQMQTPAHGAIPELDYLVGTWHAEARNPATGQTFTLDYRVEPITQGRWYLGTGRSDALGLDIHDVWGKDPVTGEIVRTIFDSAGTTGTVRSKGWDGDTLVLEGEAAATGARVMVRETIEKKGPDEFHAVWESRAADGTWSPYSVEILRRKRL